MGGLRELMGFSEETFAITHSNQSHLDLGTAGRVGEEEYKAWFKAGPPHWTLSATPPLLTIRNGYFVGTDACLSDDQTPL